MKNTFKIKPAKGQSIIGCISFALIIIIYSIIFQNTTIIIFLSIFWLMLVCFQLSFSLEFSKKNIYIHFLFFRRNISVDRISSIQFARLSNGPRLIICIDGKRPFNDSGEYKFFFCSYKVISVTLSDLRADEYAKKLSVLYNAVVIEESFIKWINKLHQKTGDGLREP